MVDANGRARDVELMVRRDTVECRAEGLARAVFDRRTMREWLASPVGVLESVRFSRFTDGQLAVSVHETLPWRLVPSYLVAALRERV